MSPRRALLSAAIILALCGPGLASHDEEGRRAAVSVDPEIRVDRAELHPSEPARNADGTRSIEPWTAVAGPATPTYWAASAWGDGLLFFAGGLNVDYTALVPQLQIYDTVSGNWIPGVTAIPTPVFGGVAAYQPGKLYLVGGCTATDFTATDAVQIYDVVGNSWSTGQSLPESLGGSAGGVIDGILYLTGGAAGAFIPTESPTYAYDIGGDSWSVMDDCPTFYAGMQEFGSYFGVGVVMNEKLYVGGHYTGSRDFYMLDPTQPAGAQWTELQDLHPSAGQRSPGAVGIEPMKQILWYGGAYSSGASSDNTFVYDATADTWTNLQVDLPSAQWGIGYGEGNGYYWLYGGSDGGGATDPAPFLRTRLLPTATPSPGPSPTSTATGSSDTPTPRPFGVRLELPSQVHPGEIFSVTGLLDNPGAPRTDVPTFFILEVYGSFWFWPSWCQYAPPEHQDIDYQTRFVDTGTTNIPVIDPFPWPDTGPEEVTGLRFYGAFLTPDLAAIDGEWSMVEWGYGPNPGLSVPRRER